MKKLVLIFSFILIVCLIIFISLNVNPKYSSKDTFNDADLLELTGEGVEDLTICDNCIYIASNIDEEYISSLSNVIYSDTVTYEFGDNYISFYETKTDVTIGTYYKKVGAIYNLSDNYAYWNVEFTDGSYGYYNYSYDIVSLDISNAYLVFVYYKENDNWYLLQNSSYIGKTSSIISGYEEYVLFNFYFIFDSSSSSNANRQVAYYSIFHYKNGE